MKDVTLVFEFPNLAPNLDMKIHGRKGKVTCAVYLPKDYDKRRKIPACFFLNGFTGGPSTAAGSAREIVGDRGYISINLPLFKKRVARLKKDNSNYWMRAFIEDKDYPAIWEAYRAILKRIYKEIPNIDVSRSCMGGFSNGAHITAVLLNNPRCRIYDYVSHFFFIEGGSRFKRGAALSNRHLLIYQGKKWEKPWLDEAHQHALKNAQAHVTFDLMARAEHAFPKPYKKKLAQWIKRLPAYR